MHTWLHFRMNLRMLKAYIDIVRRSASVYLRGHDECFVTCGTVHVELVPGIPQFVVLLVMLLKMKNEGEEVMTFRA